VNLRGRLGPATVTAAWAISAALLTLLAGALILGATDAGHLVAPLGVSIALTVAAIAIAARWFSGTTLRLRFVGIGVFATVIGLANLAVLASLMVVSDKDAELVAVLLIYSTGVAIGAGLAAGRASAAAIERIAEAARRMSAGELEARAGETGGGRELERLAAALDEMAAKLEAAQRRERAIEAQRQDLIVAVSHDLRTPLADLRAMAEAIEDRVVSDPATVHAYAARMSRSVDSLSRLVDDLFEFVQLEAGAIEAETERARVEQVVGWAVEACDGQAALKGLHLSTELGELGATACSPRITRVLQNLLANAIRHTPSDGTVRVSACRQGSAIELAVEDSGDGIDADAVERVFEPFWRGDAARAGEGSGLGLALAKRIVESLGGEIAVESSPTVGSRFAVRLPRPG
jgi:signal transduction histidine kinase